MIYTLALIAGVLIVAGGNYAGARYVSRRWPERALPAFGFPNIHYWNWLRSGVPTRVMLPRAACLVAGVFLIATATAHVWPGWAWVGLPILLAAAIVPVEVVRRLHNRRSARHQPRSGAA